MTRRYVRIEPFTGKPARTVEAIVEALDREGHPMNPYQMFEPIRKIWKRMWRGEKNPTLATIASVARRLEPTGYLRIDHTKERKNGQRVPYYDLTAKIRLAKWLKDSFESRGARALEGITETAAASILKLLRSAEREEN